ncbi:class I SAM-dependent methyltransferase [Desulfobotulus sp.]|jgi:ubiquinone/menaquinone biosynthesis C-methylase UbiE|uniref:class I SAM-dependent methyltransferase n=1 Tax=Desulfobotulus sp. TaxID=1940337 RepID=UPI002A367D15|nr:class I SAM-dependent methyltransferase [Desulfobotulus sp.]MDY0163939.1 class I SAM-dependent methyltransferase [Desulfobotulus sp.]
MKNVPIAAGKSSFGLVDTQALREALEPMEGLVILDAACGAGNYTLALARWAGLHSRIYAVDLWEEGVFELRRRIGDAGLSHVQAHVADLSQGTTLAQESVDLCLAATVIHDLVADGKVEGMLKALARTLKKEGRLAVVEFEKKPGPPGPPEALRLSPEALSTLVRPFGFSLTEIRPVGEALYLAIFAKV